LSYILIKYRSYFENTICACVRPKLFSGKRSRIALQSGNFS
jgi:hypothetical protein